MAKFEYWGPVVQVQGWKRVAISIIVPLIGFAAGHWWDKQAETRLGLFRYRSNMYGDMTRDGGWRNTPDTEQLDN